MTTDQSERTKEAEGDRATRLATWLGVCVVAILAGAAWWGSGQRPSSGEDGDERSGEGLSARVTRLAGASGFERCDALGQACRKLEAASKVAAGSRLRTDYRTRAEIELADGSTLLLDRATELALPANERVVRVTRGALIAELSPSRAKGLRFELPLGVVRATGTKFALSVDDDGGSVDVLRGSVALENRAGERAFVNAGELGRLWRDYPPTVSPSPSLADRLAWGEAAFGESREPTEVHRGLGELVARKPGETSERRGAVTLTSHAVRVRIAGAMARTEVEEVFTNHTDDVLEGIFRFPLPPDAQIERLALEVDGELVEGAFVERDRGAAIWRGALQNAAPKAPKPREEIVWVPGPWRDPALLEWQRGGRFELRIFPIPKRGARRVVLAYTQTVPAAGGVRRYGYPLAYDPGDSTRVGRFSADIEVRGHDTERGVRTAGYALEPSSNGDASSFRFEQRDFSPSGDLVVEYALPERSAELSAFAYREATNSDDTRPYLALALRPKLPRAEHAKEVSVALVVDASRSMFGENFRRASDLVVKVARELDSGTKLSVLACHTECVAMSSEPLNAGPAAALQARRFLDGVIPEGASDLVAAARAGYDATGSDSRRIRKVIYIGDGAPTVGPIRPGTIERAVARWVDRSSASISTVGIGSDSDPSTLRALARSGGGVMLPYAPGRSVTEMAYALVGSVAGSTLSDVSVELPPGVGQIAPSTLDNIPAGGEAWLVARLSGDGALGSVVLRGRVAGRPFEQRYQLNVEASSGRGNAFVPRLYAAARIAELEREGTAAARDEAIALSRRYSVASRYTSLLVLESQAMFEAFGLDNQRVAETWTGEERAEGTTAGGIFEVGEQELALDAEFGGGGPSSEAKQKHGLLLPDELASRASGMAASAPAAAPKAATRALRPPSRSAEEAPPVRLERDDPLSFAEPPHRQMIPMRRVWERYAEIFTERLTPKGASAEALSALEPLVFGELPRREDTKKLFVLAMRATDLERAARVAERWADKEPLDAEALTARADVAARRGSATRPSVGSGV